MTLRMRGPARWLALCLLLTACDSGGLLTVDLASDLVPGREFTSLETTVSLDPPGTNPAVLRRVERTVEQDEDFLVGRRAAGFEGLMPGRYFVQLTLRAADRSVVISQVGEVEIVEAVTTLTLRANRDCVGVECPGSGPPGNLACLAGMCVDPRCSPESPEFCPPVECEADGDCTPAGVACADVSCLSGTCFVWSGGAACPEATWCDPDVGCVPEDPGMAVAECDRVFCDVGNECEVGLLACDGSGLCQLAANAFAGSPCGRGECDGEGACVGLPLDVTVEGTGTIVSEPARLVCDGDSCRERFERDSTVSLVALPAEGFQLDAWAGDCDLVDLDRCTLDMDAARQVTARFQPRIYVVQVTYSGTGTGDVVIQTAGEADVDCAAPGCSVQRTHGTEITLVATPTGGSTFAGWGGVCASETGTTCTVASIEEALDVGVSFATEADLLRVIQSGSGDGTVTSTPPGIDCGAVCAAPFTGDVMLEAEAAFGSTFVGWAGDAAGCGTDPTCTVSVSGLVTAEAQWMRGRYELSIDPTMGSGTGTVTSMPSGIDCPGTCTATFDGGDVVTLLAVPGPNMQVAGWTGVSCAGSTCDVPIGAATAVGVVFEPVPVTLTVARDGAGAGRVDSTPAGITCGGTCSAVVPHGTSMVLTATAETGSDFTGWTGGGCGVANPCTVVLTADTSVRATFAVSRHDVTVTVGGDGTGAVTTDLFTCAGGPCVQDYEHGETVSLYADVTTGNFAGWGGACAPFGTAETCLLTLTDDVDVSATFTLSDYTLSVGQAGDGSGTITSTAGINCLNGAGTCTLSVTEGTMDRLVAVPAAGSRFIGWTGACSGTGACDVTVSGPTTVNAQFERIQHELKVVVEGETDHAEVTTGDGTIRCPGRCAAFFPEGAVTLFADVAAGYIGTWSEPSCGTSRECRIVLPDVTAIQLTVTRGREDLSVSVTGEGVGKVESDEPVFVCEHGETCTLEAEPGQVVRLRAVAGDGSVFVRWDGAPGCTTELTCDVRMGEVESVRAVFEPASGASCRLLVETLSEGISVVSSPAGIECPGVCLSGFSCASNVLLRSSVRANWTGCEPALDGLSCTVTFLESTVAVSVSR